MLNSRKLITAKFLYNRKKLSLSGREDKKDITFKIRRIYFQNLIGYNCITSFAFLSKHVSNVSWVNFRLLFIFYAWRSLTRRLLFGSHEIVFTEDGEERPHYLFIFFFSIWVFFYTHSRFTGQPGKGEGIYLTPLYLFHPLHRLLDISRAITVESSPLHIASSNIRNGNF